MDLGTIIKTYGALGAGGLALVVLVWLLIYLVTKISPTLEQLRSENEAHKEVIRNNTEAIKEVSRSNENVANALSLLEGSFSTFARLLEKHDARSEQISNEVLKIRESMKSFPRE